MSDSDNVVRGRPQRDRHIYHPEDKVRGRPERPVLRPVESKAHWFHSKSPAAKKAYIAAHPNSIYAKQAKHARGDAQRERSANKRRAVHNAKIAARKARDAAKQ